jgi:hypothetical protein
MYFRFEKREPKVVKYRMMTDVPENVVSVAAQTDAYGQYGKMVIVKRVGMDVYCVNHELSSLDCVGSASRYGCIQLLDPIPEPPPPPLPETLADCEEGRCVCVHGVMCLYFRCGDVYYSHDEGTGKVDMYRDSHHLSVHSLTDIYAVREETP